MQIDIDNMLESRLFEFLAISENRASRVHEHIERELKESVKHVEDGSVSRHIERDRPDSFGKWRQLPGLCDFFCRASRGIDQTAFAGKSLGNRAADAADAACDKYRF